MLVWIWKQNLPLVAYIQLPDVSQERSRHVSNFVHVSERGVFYTKDKQNYSKKDWNIRISGKVRNLELFGKINGFLKKKAWFFSKASEGIVFAVECVSKDNHS